MRTCLFITEFLNVNLTHLFFFIFIIFYCFFFNSVWLTIKFLHPKKESSGKFNGALGDIVYKRVDFTGNGFFIKDYESRQIEFSAAILNEKLCLVIKKAGLVSRKYTLFKV